ncbi:MAG: hypothetical protein ACR2MF_01115, partial [Chthoniobacterales bacterium]
MTTRQRAIQPILWGAIIAIGFIAIAFWLDAATREWVVAHQMPGLRHAMELVSTWGDWPSHVGLGLVLCALAYVRGRKRWLRIFAAMIVACALAGVSARVIKIAA